MVQVSPSGKNHQKNSLKECLFFNLALIKNTLLQTTFLAILPTGKIFAYTLVFFLVYHCSYAYVFIVNKKILLSYIMKFSKVAEVNIFLLLPFTLLCHFPQS